VPDQGGGEVDELGAASAVGEGGSLRATSGLRTPRLLRMLIELARFVDLGV
jgi:hypothetical protein